MGFAIFAFDFAVLIDDVKCKVLLAICTNCKSCNCIRIPLSLHYVGHGNRHSFLPEHCFYQLFHTNVRKTLEPTVRSSGTLHYLIRRQNTFIAGITSAISTNHRSWGSMRTIVSSETREEIKWCGTIDERGLGQRWLWRTNRRTVSVCMWIVMTRYFSKASRIPGHWEYVIFRNICGNSKMPMNEDITAMEIFSLQVTGDKDSQ